MPPSVANHRNRIPQRPCVGLCRTNRCPAPRASQAEYDTLRPSTKRSLVAWQMESIWKSKPEPSISVSMAASARAADRSVVTPA